MKDIVWFKSEVEPCLKNFEIQYRFYEKGNFGDLNQVEFNTEVKGGEIDFWSSGWLYIHLVDYLNGEELINVFLKPQDNDGKEKALKSLVISLCQ